MGEVATLDQPNAVSIRTVARFWAQAADELEPIQAELAETYRTAGAAGLMEQRALSLGVMIGYLESLMAKQPARIAELGSLYTRLVEAERRAWDAERKQRPRKDARSFDLSQLANRRA